MRPYRIAILAGLAALWACSPRIPELEAPVLRGHEEVVLQEDGSLLPLVLSEKGKVGLCVEVAPSQDTSLWQMTVSFGGSVSPSGPVAPTARSGANVCFDAELPPDLPVGMFDVCARVVDGYDGSEYRVPCQSVRHPEDTETYNALMLTRRKLIGRIYDLRLDELVTQLDGLAGMASEQGYLLFSVQTTLISLHYLMNEGTPEALEEAARRLHGLPEWLDKPNACHVAALASLAKGRFYLDVENHLEEAWSELAEADRRFQAIADPKRFTVTMAQASILHQIGVVDEAITRLRAALEECEPRVTAGYDRQLVDMARSDLAWYILMNPDASDGELAEAENYLREDPDWQGESDRLELANRQVNRAYLEVRAGREPRDHLEKARRTLAAVEIGGERAHFLAGWADLVDATHALTQGHGGAALELCSPLSVHPNPQLAARSLSCLARAYRMEGRPAAAGRAVGEALALAYASMPRSAPSWHLGPGHRADDFGRAALLAIERGDANQAWKLLQDLDQLSISETQRRVCRERAVGEDRRRWEAIEDEVAAALRDIRMLERPASRQRRGQQERLLAELKLRLQELWREWPGCEEEPPASDEGLRYRAFAVEDEIVLLCRDEEQRARVIRRTPFPRSQLRRLHDRILVALEDQDLDDDEWREMLGGVAQALVPEGFDDDPDAPPLTYALHGLLQTVPLAALPVGASKPAANPAKDEAVEAGGADAWLGLRTKVAVHPAGARIHPRRPSRADADAAAPLFVVDPRSNLPAAPRLLATYRQLFPQARILRHEEATYATFRREVGRATWLHVDAHGLYDPVFPRLSALQLADRPIHWFELADTPMNYRFAHLSGCHTGRWPVTPDSGTYGLAGLVTRLGVSWAIASRSDLDDRVAMDFNRAFYVAIDAGMSVPAAYREALREVARNHPASAWGGFVLLRSAGSD